MKNILQKIFLFLTVFLFNWGYGQICISTDIQKIASEDTYSGINANINSLTPGGTGNDAALSSNIQYIHDNDLNTFFLLQSTLPKNSGSTINPNYVPGTLNANFSVNNLDIKNGEIVYLKVGEDNRFGGTLSTTAATITYTITAFKGNTSFNINPVNSLTSISSSRTGTLSFTAPDDIDKITVVVNASKPFNGTAINIFPQSRLQIQFYGIYVNPLCQPTPCNTTIPITKEFYGESITSGGTILLPHENLINSDTSDGVTFVAIGNTWVKKETPFKQNSYVGFNIDEGSLLSLATQFTITTSLNNVDVETRTFTNGGISLISGGSRLVGFKTEQLFDQVRINILAFSVGGVTVKNAFIIEPCPDEYVVECNVNTPLVQSEFPAIIVNERSGNTALATAGNIFSNPANIIDNDLDNYATIFAAAGAASTSSIAVKSVGQTFPGGYFAGFLVENSSLVNLDLLSNIRIKTYLNGNLVETAQGSALGLNLQLLPGTNKRVIGFNTTEGDAYDFDEVVFETFSTVAVSIGVTNIYHAIIRKNCFGPEPVCNIETPITSPTYPATIQAVRTGTSGALNLSSVTNAANVINANTSDFATMSITGLLASASLSVSTGNQQFAGGNFVGFDVANTNLLDVDLLGGTVIKTYMNGVLVEQSNSNTLLLDVNILSGSPRAVVGFITTQPFNEVQYEMSTLLSANPFGETRIYNMIIKKFCEGDELPCNVSTLISKTSQPITIKDTNVTGVSLGGINNVNNILDGDENTYAEINITASVLSTATISLEKLLTPYPANTYVSFDIEINNLVQISVLPEFSIVLLNNGVEVGRTSGGNFLLGVAVGTSVRKTLGYLAPAAFNEIKFIYEQPIGVSLGNVKLYDLKLIKACQNPIDCSDSDVINTLERPVVINEFRTGPEGIGCVGCSVQNAENLISPNTTDYTTLNMAVGVGGSAGVSVLDLTNIYPSGTYVGFTIEDVPYLLQADVFEGFFVRTYLNGVEQEVVNDADILDLSIIFSIGTGTKNYGFRAEKPFNEVRFEVFSLVSAFNTIKVYNLRIDASSPTANDGNINCINGVCVKPGSTVNGGDPTKIGISNSENTRSTWPDDIKNGFLALDSKSKGMIISRVTNSNLITEPKLGMLVYDISSKCVKLYNGVSWNCIKQSCND